MELGTNCSLSFLIISFFNNMLKFDEKCNQVDVTPYETGDFENCCFNVGLTDMKST